MTFSRLLPLLCAAAVGATASAARAEDNAAQSAARIALAKQLFDMNAQPATNAPAADAKVMMHPADEAKAPVQPETAPTVSADQSAPSVSNSDAAKRAAAEKAALAAAMTAKTNSVAQIPVMPATNSMTAKPADLNYPGKDIGLKPVAAPPLPINNSKQERLQALLDKYKSDQLTPDEYHQQRAAILAEP